MYITDALKENNHLKSMMQGLQNAAEAANSADPPSAHAARASRLEEEKEMLEVMLMTLEEHHAKCADKINGLTTQLSDLRLENDRSSEPNRRVSDPNDPASSIFKVRLRFTTANGQFEAPTHCPISFGAKPSVPRYTLATQTSHLYYCPLLTVNYVIYSV